jgi:hypothetical protein
LVKRDIKKYRFLKWPLRMLIVFLIFTLVFLMIYLGGKGPKNTSTYTGGRKVFISQQNGQYSFTRNGKPFLVKGGAGYTYLAKLAASGGNTIICWDTSKITAVLAEAEKYKLAVIVGLDIPGGDDFSFYKDEKNIEVFYKAYSKIVLRCKDHPSLLAWCLGNELEMPASFTTLPFYKAYNRLLQMIHTADPHHPVATALMNVPKRKILNMQWRIPALDFYCINTYNRLKVIEDDLNLMKYIWNGPFLVGEWAPNGGWEVSTTNWQAPIENTSTKKAEQYYELYSRHMPLKNPRFLGSLAFYWGIRQEYTHTWYSVFSEDGAPNEIAEVLKDCWNGVITPHLSPKVKYMLIDSLGGQDNIIVSTGSLHKASILFDSTAVNDSLRYCWQIVKEDWLTWGSTWKNFKKPPLEKGLLFDSTLQNTKFLAPAKAGPYRVYVTVYNSKGYCATANTPIYVVE